MAVSGVAVTVEYMAWDTDAQAYKTGDAANHTLRLVADGAEATPSGTPAEVDATNAPGLYKIALTGAEHTGTAFAVAGKSSTANVIIIPVSWHSTAVAVSTPPTASANGTAAAAAILVTPANKLVTDDAGSVVAGNVTDKAGYSLATAPPTAADIATAVWGATTRTLSGFGTLVADVAAGVWAAATRTLTDKTGFRLSSTGVAEVAAAAKTGSAAAQVVVGGTPAQYPTGEVVVVRGDETVITLEFADQDGAPIDLTPYTTGAGELTLTVKPRSARNDADDANALLQLTGASASPTTGIGTFTLTAATSELATVGEVYDVDVQGDAGSGHVATLMVGTFEVTLDVTRVSSATPAP